MKRISVFFILLAHLLTLTGCSTVKGLFGGDEDEDPQISEDVSAQRLYQEANRDMVNNQFPDAIEKYTLLESRYPFGRYAQQAQLELIFLYYRQGEMDLAIANADRFIRLNPQHPNVDYAYYMKGLANFDKSKTVLNFVLPRDPSEKDPSSLSASFDDFSALIQKFPGSRYADDAQQRMIFLRNELAEHEITVADFYMRRGAYVAAINRATYAIERYQGAPAMPQAVYTLELAYRQLGLNDLAFDTHKVYAQNFLSEDGTLLDPEYATTKISCASNTWQRMLEKLRFRTYYCD
ncbi:MAG: outer membrane protein assembly factor BamD [Pseudomonadota bacterium]